MTSRTIVVDYGIGNVFSVCNAVKAAGGDVELTGDLQRIRAADRVILPGVGAFARAMNALKINGIDDAIREFVATERPFLGICIGMQVLMDGSVEFGDHKGLGLIPGDVRRIDEDDDGAGRRVPHIGWAPLATEDPESWSGTALANIASDDSVYFVHSYHCVPAAAENVFARADYDGLKITAAIRRDNIFGVQFHPERSGAVGQQVLASFIAS